MNVSILVPVLCCVTFHVVPENHVIYLYDVPFADVRCCRGLRWFVYDGRYIVSSLTQKKWNSFFFEQCFVTVALPVVYGLTRTRIFVERTPFSIANFPMILLPAFKGDRSLTCFFVPVKILEKSFVDTAVKMVSQDNR